MGVPAGVINVVTGYGAEAGEALATSKGISKIGFTGSTATGTRILKAAADNMIPATLELGGKSPRTRRRLFISPMTQSMVSALVSGLVTLTSLTQCPVLSRLGVCGSTAITLTQHTPHLAATSNRDL